VPFKQGDHIFGIYSTTEELARQVASFLVEGLRKHERCWYVGDGAEIDSVRAALRKLKTNVTADTKRGALELISGDAAYIVDGTFHPEATMQIFNNNNANQAAVLDKLAQLDRSSSPPSEPS
jgi:two-component system, sensor histidine kinase PdtaS